MNLLSNATVKNIVVESATVQSDKVNHCQAPTVRHCQAPTQVRHCQ